MLCILLAWPFCGPRAWNAAGHRTISCLALEAADLRAAPWLGTMEVRERILFQSNHADRLRSRQSPVLRHLNEADHYFEMDRLGSIGLTLNTVPPLRRAYLQAIVLADQRRGETAPPVSPPQYLLAGPGFLAHGMAESRDLLAAALHQVRILEILADPRRDLQLKQSRADVIHALGRLGHLVGDGSQPLHTTRHFNGWIGVNPHGFTRSKAFHRLVDSRPGGEETLSCAGLLSRLPAMATGVQVTSVASPTDEAAEDRWDEMLDYLGDTHALVEPLYALERDGRFNGPDGTSFIAGRLLAGATMLAVLLQGALEESRPTADDITRFIRQVKRPSPKEKPPAGKEPDRQQY
jgi:hypothetical protein